MLVPETRVEAVGDVWAAFSPASGQTMLLNDASAAVLGFLSQGPADSAAVCEALSADSGLPEADIAVKLEESWPRLIEAGLIRQILLASIDREPRRISADSYSCEIDTAQVTSAFTCRPLAGSRRRGLACSR
jgi:PqqD family protein of HPr-rel-A system